MRLISLLLILLLNIKPLYADKDSFEFNKKQEIETTVTEVLQKYCADECKLLSVNLELYEEIEAREDLGFEALDNTADAVKYNVSRANVFVQINSSVNERNKERLSRLISLRFKQYG